MGAGSATVFQMISNSGPMVQAVIGILGALSVLSWSIIIAKTVVLFRTYRQNRNFSLLFSRSNELADVYSKLEEFPRSPFARVFGSAYAELSRTSANRSAADAAGPLRRVLESGSLVEEKRLRSFIHVLATIGNTTPFIGLFGTVWGIMNSFHGIGQRGSASLAVVAPGISEALVATALGLVVAIPAVIAFNAIGNRVTELSVDIQKFAFDLLNIIERSTPSSKHAAR